MEIRFEIHCCVCRWYTMEGRPLELWQVARILGWAPYAVLNFNQRWLAECGPNEITEIHVKSDVADGSIRCPDCRHAISPAEADAFDDFCLWCWPAYITA